MSIPIRRVGVEIFTSPKVLSTSLKHLAFEIDNDRPFEDSMADGPKSVHNIYPARAFQETTPLPEFVRVGFVRDPVERLLSAFRNRVIKRSPNELAQWSQVREQGLDPSPSLEYFVENLSLYQKALPTIMHHSAPQVFYLGNQSDFYEHIFSDRQTMEFQNYLSELLGRRITLPWTQISQKDMPFTITSNIIERVREYYKEDYEVFGEAMTNEIKASDSQAKRPSRKLIIHIGAPKTGTTSLQKFFHVNRSMLKAHGVNLLESPGSPNNIGLAAFFSSKGPSSLPGWYRKRGLASLEDKRKFFQGVNLLEKIRMEVDDFEPDCHTVILTSEQLWSHLLDDDVSRLALWAQNHFESCQVVLYLRDEVELLSSSWSQSIKGGSTQSLRSEIKKTLSSPPDSRLQKLKVWNTHFYGSTSVNVYKKGADWDVRSEFVKKYIPEVQGLSYPLVLSNRSYGRFSIQIIRLLNAIAPVWKEGAKGRNPKNVKMQIILRPLLNLDKTELRLSRKQEALLREHFRSSNLEMFQYLEGHRLLEHPYDDGS